MEFGKVLFGKVASNKKVYRRYGIYTTVLRKLLQFSQHRLSGVSARKYLTDSSSKEERKS